MRDEKMFLSTPRPSPHTAFFTPHTAFLLTLLVSAGALGAALIAQFAFGFKPCVMCLWQRAPYALLIAGSCLALIGMGDGGRGTGKEDSVPRPASPVPLQKSALFILALLFLLSAGLAFFHFGIEQHWWSLENGCKVGELKGKTTEDMVAELLATPQAECDKVAWRVLGLSITVWNTALSLAMAGYLLVVASKKKFLSF